jgi:S-formylglutathione hydrolase FrmB
MRYAIAGLVSFLLLIVSQAWTANNIDQTMYSAVMQRTISYNICIPTAHFSQTTRRFPVLYALHGMGAPYATMTGMNATKTAIDLKPMYVVTFNGDNASWYLDSPLIDSSQFTTFFFNEFIPKIDSVWRTRTDGKYRAVTGFSMGGFGALHYMLCRTDLFSSISSMSGAFYALGELGSAPNSSITPLLGSKTTYPQRYIANGIFTRLDTVRAHSTPLPPIYLACGTEDGLISDSRKLRDTLQHMGRAVQEVETAGAHNYTYWVSAMPGIIAFHAAWFDSVTSGISKNKSASPSDFTVEATVFPQPVDGAARFVISNADSRSNAGVELFDPQGRLVRRLAVSNGTADWDGRRTDGTPAAAGLYLYRIQANGQRVCGSLVVKPR